MKGLLVTFHNLPIRKKLVFSFSALVIIPILISLFFSNRIIGGIVLAKIGDANTGYIHSASKRIDKLLDDITDTLLSISRNPELKRVLNSNKEELGYGLDISQAETVRRLRIMNSILENVPVSMLMYSTRITVLSNKGKDYGNWESFSKFTAAMEKNLWYNEVMESYSGKIRWIGIDRGYKEWGQNSFMVEAAIPIKESEYSLNNIGVVHVGIPERFIYEVLKSENTQYEMMLIDENDIILSGKDKNSIGNLISRHLNIGALKSVDNEWYVETTNDKRKIVISVSNVSRAGWKVVSVLPYDKMLAPLSYVRNILLAINIAAILSFLLVSVLISKSISRPIIQMNEKMKWIEDGNLDERMEVVYADEIGNLGRNFNKMLERINELISLNKLQEKHKREAELEALQAQINPHFLFNTLSSIRWAAAASGDTKVEDMVFALSNLLKMSISKGPDMIDLEEEITFLKYYIKLFQMKQGIRLDFSCGLAPEMLKVKIPRFLLQPIVENAILHGFEGKKPEGRIAINGEINGSLLKIDIADNGKGIDALELEGIFGQKTATDRKKKYFKRIGIRNVEERIKLNYGKQYGLEIKNGEAGGTVVTLTLPAFTEELSDA